MTPAVEIFKPDRNSKRMFGQDVLTACLPFNIAWPSRVLPSGGIPVIQLLRSWDRGSSDKCRALPPMWQGLAATTWLSTGFSGGVCGAGYCMTCLSSSLKLPPQNVSRQSSQSLTQLQNNFFHSLYITFKLSISLSDALIFL